VKYGKQTRSATLEIVAQRVVERKQAKRLARARRAERSAKLQAIVGWQRIAG
jgi:hypothetical protein